MNWTPIGIASKEAKPHPQDAELFRLEIKLTARPPAEWAHEFLHAAGSFRVIPGGTKLVGDIVTVSAEQTGFEGVIADVRARIEFANREYERAVLPAIARQEAQVKSRADAQAARLADARKALDQIE